MHTVIESPIGQLMLVGDDENLRGVYMLGSPKATPELEVDDKQQSAKAFAQTTRQLRAYFAGELRQFDLALRPKGTPFQLAVWRALVDIAFGETASYGQIALAVGRPKASRAVGAANGCNPIAVIVPCHRVIGSNGTLVGYGGGLDRKQWLLGHEQTALNAN